MKINRLYIWVLAFPLVLWACRGEDPSDVNPPSPGPDSGQTEGEKVRPEPGNGWTVTTIDDGIIYYAFDGVEPITKTNQRIFVTETDLNNASYSVKMGYYSGNSTASKVLKGTGAIASINGGYEKAALYIKFNDSVISDISADYVGNTGVPQWKSEAAIYMDQDRDVRIEFTGKGMNIAQWRSEYRKRGKTETYMLTSAPMLIDNYKPVGLEFCTLHPLSAWGPDCSENPYRHQSSNTNPRTAMAKTEDNHLLFIVVDGRREGISRGISAADLTKFLVKNFNPQYAINLDGGGSSTMCVRGQGDPVTYVVNYPCNNKSEDYNGSPKEKDGPDHAGERPRDTFFYVVKK